jgi:hypothetical protein
LVRSFSEIRHNPSTHRSFSRRLKRLELKKYEKNYYFLKATSSVEKDTILPPTLIPLSGVGKPNSLSPLKLVSSDVTVTCVFVCVRAATQASPPSEKLKRVKEEYERRVATMSRELRRLQAAQREHTRLQRSQQHAASQLMALRADLHNMKRDKVTPTALLAAECSAGP